MINVENLTKIYETKKTKCEALKNVSFALPEKGLVFILGKSGSGKSTLLNLLGGLDSITSGDITVGDKKYSEFSVKDFDNFRNEKLGFIFQDFCLIDELNVEDNVKLVLDLQSEQNDDIVTETLVAVGLEGLEKRYPKELSAGQKQRVAIARALVKRPKIILADEPTGNIDTKTAQVVLDILDKMSAEKLVVVISHNYDDAVKYADRIIELADGQIIRDETRSPEYQDNLVIELPDIILPYNKKLTADDVKKLNTAIATQRGEVHVDQNGSGYNPTVQPTDSVAPGDYKNKGMKAKSLFRYSAMFFKKRWLGGVLSIISITFLMIVFGLAQLFTMFDGESQLQSTVAKYGDRGLIVRQGSYPEDDMDGKLNTSNLLAVSDEKESALKAVYGEGEIYKMYNVIMPVSCKSFSVEKMTAQNFGKYSKGFASESNGVLACNIDYIKHLYGADNGELNVLAGDIKEASAGVIITDYLADSLLYFQPVKYKEYADIINDDVVFSRVKVDAIIRTGYKDRYQPLINAILNGEKSSWKNTQMRELADEIMNYLSVPYSINLNFYNDYINWICSLEKSELYSRQGYAEYDFGANQSIVRNMSGGYFSDTVNPDEIKVGLSLYNELNETEYTDDDLEKLNTEKPFAGTTVTVRFAVNEDTETYLTHTFQVVGVVERGLYEISKDYLRTVKTNEIQPVALYFENSVNGMAVASKGDELAMYPVGYRINLIRQITKIVVIFDDIFFYIAIALCIAIGVLLAMNSMNNIRQNAYEIGVIRAMGGRTGQLGGIFAIQTAFSGLAIAALTALGDFLGVILFNNVLIESISKIVKAPGIETMNILIFNPYTVLIDVGIIVALTVLTIVVPVLAVRKIQPIKIIRSRE